MSRRSRPDARAALVIMRFITLTVGWKYTEVYIRERETIRPSAAGAPLWKMHILSLTTLIVDNIRSMSMLPMTTPV